jgi:hypothetical protein
MSAAHGAFNVTQAAQKLPLNAAGALAAQLRLVNKGPNPVYIGHDATVTANTGFPVPSNNDLNPYFNEVMSGVDFWVITVTADQVSPANLRWIAEG